MNKRILVSTGIALVFVLVWQLFISPAFFPPAPPPAPVNVEAGAPTAPGKTDPAAAPASAVQDNPEVEGLALESATYRLALTNKGAGVRELTLKASAAKEEVKLLAPHAGVAPHLALKAEGERIETIGWEVAEKSDRAVAFRTRLSTGVEILKTFEMPADGSRPLLKVALKNLNAPPEGKKDPAPVTVALQLLAINGMDHDSEYRYEQYAAGFAHTEKGVEHFLLPNVLTGEEKLAAAQAAGSREDWESAAKYLRVEGTQKTWFAAKNRFFALAVVPDEVTKFRVKSIWFRAVTPAQVPVFEGRKGLMASAGFDAASVGAEPVAWGFSLFASPLKKGTLAEIPKGDELLNYGGGCASGCGPLSPLFAPMVAIINLVAPLILGVLGFLGGLLGNYGVAIIATTLCIRLALFPLSKKSQVSMYKMQQLGPKITALRERYKDDQQKFGMEQMRLFRENKINPLSGCLPMLMQMPIFIAMYSVFEMSVDLRGKRFLWMELHEPDKLVDWAGGFVIPLISLNLDAFNLLPIIMTITWFLQSWYAPRSPDPQMAAQQKMMLAMPVVFGLMCYNLASGLSLYFFVNSLLSMTEQKLIKKFFLKPGPGDGPKG